MRVVMPVAIPELIRFRELTGADRFDEMWEGVLHMAPSPTFHHQTHASRLLSFFVEVWCPVTGGAAVMQINVSSPERWDQDYRIPEVSVILPDRVPRGEAMFVQPNVVFEVRSPGDETYEKLPFYAAIGVEAVVGRELRSRTSVGRRLDAHRAHRGRVAGRVDGQRLVAPPPPSSKAGDRAGDLIAGSVKLGRSRR
jgi:Uma2 family endonuclease